MAAPPPLVVGNHYKINRPIGAVPDAVYNGSVHGQYSFRYPGGVLFFDENQQGISYEALPVDPSRTESPGVVGQLFPGGGRRRRTSKKGLRKTRRRRSRHTRRRK